MAPARKLDLRLFLEGQEVPVIAASVAAQVGSPATASIQVVATDRLLDLKPRTLVHLFFFDYYEAFEGDEKTQPPSSDADVTPDQGLSEKYKLLFAGEVVAITMQRTNAARQGVLQCLDFSSYWDTAKQYYHESFGMSSEASRLASFVGAGTTTYDHIIASPGGGIIRLLQTAPATYPEMKGLLGGLVHMLEAIGGIFKGAKRFKGMNDFFSCAEMRLNLAQMIGALEADTSSAALINHIKFQKYLSRKIQSLGSVSSFRDILNEVLNRIYHVQAPNPCAFYKKATNKTVPTKTNIPIPTSDKTKLIEAVQRLEWAKDRYRVAGESLARGTARVTGLSFSDGSRLVRGLPLSGEASPEDQKISQWSGSPLNTVRSQYKLDVQDVKNSYRGGHDNISAALRFLEGVSHGTRKFIAKAIASCAEAKTKAKALTAQVGQGLDTHLISRIQTVGVKGLDPLITVIDETIAELEAKAGKNSLGTRSGTGNKFRHPRLSTNLLLPQCFFVSPPRCNVLFPELVTAFSFNRSFMQEITRMRLTTTSEFLGVDVEGEGMALPSLGKTKHIYLAPKIRTVIEDTTFGSAKKAVGTLLPHEVFSGIIPSLEWMGDIKQLKIQERNVSPNVKIDYTQRLCNFLFFRKRLGARTLSGSGIFNPHLVPGFPALVLDRFTTKELSELYATKGLKEAETALKAQNLRPPTQYMGYLARVTHTIGQTGGTTSFTLTHCRTHNEREEFLGANEQVRTERVGTITENVSANFNLNVALGALERAHTISVAMVEANRDEDIMETSMDPGAVHAAAKRAQEGKVLKPELDAQSQVAGYASVLTKGTTKLAVLHELETALTAMRLASSTSLVKKWGEARKKVIKYIMEGKGFAGRKTQTQIERVQMRMRCELAIGELKTFSGKLQEGIYDEVIEFIPPEEVVRPPWFSPIYNNSTIGEQVYKPLIGTGSISDEIDVQSVAEQLAIAESEEAIKQHEEAQRGNIEVGKIQMAPTVITKFGPGSVAPDLGGGTSIEEAVDHLVRVYAYVKLHSDEVSVDSFVRQYHRREIATMVDLLNPGTFAAEPETPSDPLRSTGSPEVGELGAQVFTADAGFHSVAFGDLEPMEGLKNQDLPILGKTTPSGRIRSDIDPRRERFKIVEAYIGELRSGRALRG